MRKIVAFLIFSVCIMIECKKEGDDPILNDSRDFDVVLIAGQSNTDSGSGIDLSIDTAALGIYQLGRFGLNNWNVIRASEPLDHHDKNPLKIGFGLTFANLYVRSHLLKENRHLLLVPCGYGGTGFKGKRWNKGNDLYNDAVRRVNYIMKGNVNNRLIAILWHQGEQDVYWMNDAEYQEALDRMINNMRHDIVRAGDSIPFILGGMVPMWVNQDVKRQNRQIVIQNTPNRVRFCNYADPLKPYILSKSNDWEDMIHYDAREQRELGKRYFSCFLHLDSLEKR